MVHFNTLIIATVLFSGCSTSFSPVFPSMPIVEKKNFTWEDVRYNNANVHVFTEEEWIEVRESLVNRRLLNNVCAKIVNNYIEEK